MSVRSYRAISVRTAFAFIDAALLSALAITLPSVAFAQQGQTLDPIVVTAALVDQPVSDALPSTTVISRQEIASSTAIDVASLLRRQAGIEIGQSGGLGAATSVFMRGANSDQVLFIVDGIRMNSVSTGAAVIQHLMLDEIDHIEIVRGNVSSMYGSEAIGGVIQIFTRAQSGTPSVSFDGQAGGERTRNAAFSGGGSVGQEGSKTTASLTLSSREMNGFSAVNPSTVPTVNPDDNGYRNHSVSAQISQQIGAQEVGVKMLESRGRLSYDDPTNYALYDPTVNTRTITNHEDSLLDTASIYAKLRLNAIWTADLQFGESHDRSDNTSSYPFSFVTGNVNNRTQESTWHNVVQIAPAQDITAGVEHLEQTGTSDSSSFTGVEHRSVDSALVGYDGHFGRNEVQLNARDDHYSDFGTANTGLAAYGFKLDDQWKLIAQASSAFKAPTFNDLYYPFFGNPNLKPERAHSVEGGAQYTSSQLTFRASLYRTRVNDLIVYDNSIGLANNVAHARLTGLELSASFRWQGWDLMANTTFQQPLDEDSDTHLLRRASRTANFSASRAFDRFTVEFDGQAQGRRLDTDINDFLPVNDAGYAIFNASVRYVVNAHVTVGVSLQNAFDRQYALVDGYNTPGRIALATLHTAF